MPEPRSRTRDRLGRGTALAAAAALAVLLGGACARPAPPPAPVPPPAGPERRAEPTPRPDTLARRDSLLARDSAAAAAARRDSLARIARRPRRARRPVPRPAPVAVAPRARKHEGVRVCAGGDVTLGTNLDTTWTATAAARLRRRVPALPSPESLVAPLRPLFAGADVVLLNVEGAIGDGDAPDKCGPTSTACFALRQPPAAAAALRSVGPQDAVVVGNVANNHARDAGAEGLDETLALLDSAGVLATGADSEPTEVVTAAGDTIAILGFSTSGGDAPDARDLAAVRRYVGAAAARYARVVVTVHMGAEGADAQRVRDSVEHYYGGSRGNPVAFARAATEAGADLVIGHGPHVVRALEWRGPALVAYSLGNLITYGPFQLRDPMNRGAVLCATLAADGRPRAVALRATRQRRPGRAAPDPTRRAAVLADSLGRLDFPATRGRVTRKGSVVR
ncbi:MAG TPA: CapA family protein [Gemmatimonadaceae bacterium]|nr:CapA family protein [Gemmatimonadaceae bacterium]